MSKSRLVSLVALITLSVASLNAFGLTEKAKQALIERITPIGTACQEGNPKCQVQVNTGAPRAGDVVYAEACVACHDTGAAGAPKLGDKGAWKSRIAAGKSTLYSNALNGLGGMPAKGACATCSDEEIKVAVDYMVQKSK